MLTTRTGLNPSFGTIERRSLTTSRRYWSGRAASIRRRNTACVRSSFTKLLAARAERAGKKGWAAWVAGREEQWRGIVYSDVIIGAGFAIFILSNFPPTQRFGLLVLAGLIIDILANLFVLPLLGGAQWKKKQSAV